VAEDVEVGEVVAADQHGLAERHQELAGAGAPAALLEGADGVHGGVDPLDQTGLPDQLGGEQEPGEAGEGGVVGGDVHPGCGCATLHVKSAPVLRTCVLDKPDSASYSKHFSLSGVQA
jgi:hypothetical protein